MSKTLNTRQSTICLSGVFMEIFGTGVFISGESGLGKSDLALNLIDKGHRLIADDVTEFTASTNKKIIGRCPKLLRNLIEIRGLGIIDIATIYGAHAIQEKQELELIIHLTKSKTTSRLNPKRTQKILSQNIIKIHVPIIQPRNLTLLAEIATRNFQLTKNNYNATDAFIKKQQQLLKESS